MSSLKFEIKGQTLPIYIFSCSLMELLKTTSPGDFNSPDNIHTYGRFILNNIKSFIDEDNIDLIVNGYRTHINSENKVVYENFDEMRDLIPRFQENIGDMIRNQRMLINPRINYSSFYHWTGFGLYFFIDNKDYTYFYAQETVRRNRSYKPWTPILILRSEFKQGVCLNLTKSIPFYFSFLSEMMFKLDKIARSYIYYETTIIDLIRKFNIGEIEEDDLICDIEDLNWINFKNDRTIEKFLTCFPDLKILVNQGFYELINERAKSDLPNVVKNSEKSHLLDCCIIRFLEYIYFYFNKKDSKFIQTVKAALHEPDFKKYYKDFLKKSENFLGTIVDHDNIPEIRSFFGEKVHYLEMKITPEVFKNPNQIQNIELITRVIDNKHYNQAIEVENLRLSGYGLNIIFISCNPNDSNEILKRIFEQTFTDAQILNFLSTEKTHLIQNRILIEKVEDSDENIKFTIYKEKSGDSIIYNGVFYLEND